MTEDILERAKAYLEAFAPGYVLPECENILVAAIAEVERLRSETLDERDRRRARFNHDQSELAARDARIKELSDLNESLMENGNDLRARSQKAEADNFMLALWNKRYIGHIERLEAAFLEAKYQQLSWIDGNDCGPELYTDEELHEQARAALVELKK